MRKLLVSLVSLAFLLAALAPSSVAVTGSVPAGSPASAAPTKKGSPPPPPRPTLQAALERIVARGAPGALAVVRDQKGHWSGAAGIANLQTKAPMRPEDHVRVGSVTKPMVAAAVLQLVGEGELLLDDTVAELLPGLIERNADEITVRMLLRHQSGLYDYIRELVGAADSCVEAYTKQCAHPYRPRELVEIANQHEPIFAPGTDWGYSNTNYIVLGLLIEKITGHRANTVLATRVFEPAGMTHTSLPHFDPTLPRPYAHGYAPLSVDGVNRLVDVSLCNPSAAWTAGAVVSTAADLDRFWGALLGGKLLSPRMLAAMKQTVPASGLRGPRPVGGRSVRYGLGITAVPTTCETTIWGHDGAIIGYLATAFASEHGKRRIAVAINGFPPTAPREISTAVARLVEAEFCGTATGKASATQVSSTGDIPPRVRRPRRPHDAVRLLD